MQTYMRDLVFILHCRSHTGKVSLLLKNSFDFMPLSDRICAGSWLGDDGVDNHRINVPSLLVMGERIMP